MKEVILYLFDALKALFGASLLFLARESGKDAVKSQQAQEELDAVAKANAARDRLHSDPAYTGRVRERFTRHE